MTREHTPNVQSGFPWRTVGQILSVGAVVSGFCLGLDALNKVDTTHEVRQLLDRGTSISDTSTILQLPEDAVVPAYLGDGPYSATAAVTEGTLAASAFFAGAGVLLTSSLDRKQD
jgi:hypothetical protein